MASLNWIPIAIGVLVLLLLIAVALSRRAKARQRKDIVSLPRRLKKQENPATNPSPASSVARTEQLSEITPVKAATSEASAPKLEVPAVSYPDTEVAPRERVDVAGAQAEATSILTGSKSQTPAAIDTSAREVIATELLSALAGRNPERRDRAREAFIQSGYFDDATRDLRVAEAPAERASAARKLALVRDFEATPHLIAALDDEAAEVRRSAVEALADLRDPAAIQPLNELLRAERDRKLPQSVIRHAIESCATAEHPTPPILDLQEFSPPNIPSAPIEPDREVIEI
jgi:HEAT repeat protein